MNTSGFGSANNLGLTYKPEFSIATSERWQKIYKEVDVEKNVVEQIKKIQR